MSIECNSISFPLGEEENYSPCVDDVSGASMTVSVFTAGEDSDVLTTGVSALRNLTAEGDFRSWSALSASLTLVMELDDPYLFARISFTQETKSIFLTDPQAIIPVPSEAG